MKSESAQGSKKEKHLLICRFSAMGDVILVYPVLKAVLLAYPEIRMTLLTRASYAVFFQDLPRLNIHAVDFNKDYKGLPGLFKLYRSLRGHRFEYFLDLHQSLRSRILQVFFRLSGLKCLTYQKNRAAKKEITREKQKIRRQLPHTTQRYIEVFGKIGLHISLDTPQFFEQRQTEGPRLKDFLEKHHLKLPKPTQEAWIGIAPFAQHENKIWGIHKVKELLQELSEDTQLRVFLFGGGKSETEQLQGIAQAHPTQVFCVAGQLQLEDEINLIQKLNLMLAMDSSNMHLASVAGTPVISIWGATHPDIGFAPLYQPSNHFIQLTTEQMPCRPCSAYGKKPCLRKDKACMVQISASSVAQKIQDTLNLANP